MKVGSLVECVGDRSGDKPDTITKDRIANGTITMPIIGNIYVVRGFLPTNTGIYLEEIINPKVETTSGFIEQGFTLASFRELQPPMDLSEIETFQHPLTLLTQ